MKIRFNCLAIVALAFCVALTCVPLLLSAESETAAALPQLDPLVELLSQIDEADIQRDVLRGIHDAVRGRRRIRMPADWKQAYARLSKSDNAEVRDIALILALVFGDADALTSLRRIAANPQASVASREQAIAALLQVRDAGLEPLLKPLLQEPPLRATAIRALAAFDTAEIPKWILAEYKSLPVRERQDAINTLAARVEWAFALTDAIERGDVPREDLSVFTVRQLVEFRNDRLMDRLNAVWGSVRDTDQNKAALIAEYKEKLNPAVMQAAVPARGRLVFAKTCATCHVLFDEGRRVGPELTGSQRTNLDYVLSNLIDPNALISRQYRMTVILMESGRVLTGVVSEEDDNAVTLATANDVVIVPKDEIEERNDSNVSMMPEGLVNKLPFADLRDLVAYLSGPGQVPLPDEPKPE